jgi:hypothetical protein
MTANSLHASQITKRKAYVIRKMMQRSKKKKKLVSNMKKRNMQIVWQSKSDNVRNLKKRTS